MTNNLPLRWTRLIVLSLLTVMCIITSQLYFQMYRKYKKTQDVANMLAPVGVKITIDYYDAKTIAIIIFAVSDIISFVAFKIVMLLIQDMYHTIPKCIARRLGIMDKTFSTSTLGYQTICLVFSTIFLVVPLSLFTVFAFTKEAEVMIIKNGVALECSAIAPLDDLCLLLVYVEFPYIRFGAELPWAVVLLGIVGTLVTFVAWCKRPKPTSDTHAIPSADSSRTETAVGDGSFQQTEPKEKDLEATP